MSKPWGDDIADSMETVQKAVVIDGTTVPLLTLPPGALGEIQAKTDLSWSWIVENPLGRIDVAALIVDAVYDKLGVAADARPDHDTADLIRLFVKIPGDLPDPELPGDGAGENPTPAS